MKINGYGGGKEEAMNRPIYDRRAHPHREVISAVAYHIWERKSKVGIPSSSEENWREAEKIIETRAAES